MSAEKAPKATPSPKPKKVKLVRDSFCMPKDEYAAIETLKQRSLALGKAVKKSELLRAGVRVLSQASDANLLAYIGAVPNIKTGRPSTKTTAETAPDAPTQPQAKPPVQRRKPAPKPPADAPSSSTTATAAARSTAPSKRVGARKTTAAQTPPSTT